MVVIEVANNQARQLCARHLIDDLRLKSPVSLTEQHRNAAVLGIDDRQIEFAVAVKVTRRKRGRILTCGVVDMRLEAPIPVTQQYAHGAGVADEVRERHADLLVGTVRVSDRQVQDAIVVEVRSDHGRGRWSRRITGRRIESAPCVPQND